jgi:hypothetical protein
MSTADGGDSTAGRRERTDAPRKRIHHRKVVVIGVVGMFLLYLAVSMTVLLLQSNTQATTSCDGASTAGSRSIVVNATVIAVDSANQQATMRLDFFPLNGLVDANQNLAQRLDVTVQGLVAAPSSSDSLSTFSYAKGEFMQSLPVTIPLGGVAQLNPNNLSQVQSSQFGVYPWDHYTIPNYFGVEVTTPGEPTPATCVSVSSQAEGWSSTIVAQQSSGNQFDITLWRSPAVLVYNYFMMALVWTLSIAGVAMAIMLVLRDRDLRTKERIDVDVFVYLAALLFAFPLIRQTLPGAPPFGTLIDIASYFWAEVIVAATLLSMVVIWIVREDRRHHDHLLETQAPEDGDSGDGADDTGPAAGGPAPGPAA